MKNWKTTVAGIATIIAAVAHAATQFASGGIGAVDFTVLTAGVTAGIGLLRHIYIRPGLSNRNS